MSEKKLNYGDGFDDALYKSTIDSDTVREVQELDLTPAQWAARAVEEMGLDQQLEDDGYSRREIDDYIAGYEDGLKEALKEAGKRSRFNGRRAKRLSGKNAAACIKTKSGSVVCGRPMANAAKSFRVADIHAVTTLAQFIADNNHDPELSRWVAALDELRVGESTHLETTKYTRVS